MSDVTRRMAKRPHMSETQVKATPNLSELQDIARCLNSLLYDPHPGLFTWRQALDAQLVAVAPFCPLNTREESLVRALEAARDINPSELSRRIHAIHAKKSLPEPTPDEAIVFTLCHILEIVEAALTAAVKLPK